MEPEKTPVGPVADSVRALHAETTEDGLGHRIVASAAAQVPGAGSAALTLAGRRRSFTTAAWTSDAAARIETLQLSAGAGPTLEAASAAGPPLGSGDLRGDGRWPLLAVRAEQLGMRSALFVPLYTHKGPLGALSLYSPAVNAFSGAAEAAAALLAEHASVVLAAHQLEGHLRRGLEYRDVIGQALGILMERHRVTRDEAFERLVAESQRSNVKLRYVADTLAATGELAPPRAPPRGAHQPPAAPFRPGAGTLRRTPPRGVSGQEKGPGADGSNSRAARAGIQAHGDCPTT